MVIVAVCRPTTTEIVPWPLGMTPAVFGPATKFVAPCRNRWGAEGAPPLENDVNAPSILNWKISSQSSSSRRLGSACAKAGPARDWTTGVVQTRAPPTMAPRRITSRRDRPDWSGCRSRRSCCLLVRAVVPREQARADGGSGLYAVRCIFGYAQSGPADHQLTVTAAEQVTRLPHRSGRSRPSPLAACGLGVGAVVASGRRPPPVAVHVHAAAADTRPRQGRVRGPLGLGDAHAQLMPEVAVAGGLGRGRLGRGARRARSGSGSVGGPARSVSASVGAGCGVGLARRGRRTAADMTDPQELVRRARPCALDTPAVAPSCSASATTDAVALGLVSR